MEKSHIEKCAACENLVIFTPAQAAELIGTSGVMCSRCAFPRTRAEKKARRAKNHADFTAALKARAGR